MLMGLAQCVWAYARRSRVSAVARLADHERAGGRKRRSTSAYSESSQRALWLENAIKSRTRDVPHFEQPSQFGLDQLLADRRLRSTLVPLTFRTAFFLRNLGFPNSLISLVAAGDLNSRPPVPQADLAFPLYPNSPEDSFKPRNLLPASRSIPGWRGRARSTNLP